MTPKFCTVCDCTLGKGNTSGRCISHGRWTPERASLPPRRQKTRVLLKDWCPPERMIEARRLLKSFRMLEVRRIIETEIAAVERERVAALSPFERQMEAVRRGVGLVQKFEPVRSYDRTLGGVSSI